MAGEAVGTFVGVEMPGTKKGEGPKPFPFFIVIQTWTAG
ncbi:hypothetical protein YM18_3254 [Geobacter sulfurreducens]|nr:hypothetical protein YM18_3254 [Geobacter sulfurreducens]